MNSHLTPLESGPTDVKCNFRRDESFDPQFDQIPNLIWYPYVGKHFGENGVRIMVYAHNIPQPPEVCEYKMKNDGWNSKSTWAASMDEYTYVQKKYTNSFRCFIKGAVGLQKNYSEISKPPTEPSVLHRINSFVERIAYLNFIQGLVKSDVAIARAEPDQIELSKKINREILRILDITHCICWGAPTYQYVCSITDFKSSPQIDLGKSGFSTCTIEMAEGKMMNCLRIPHPSRPQTFGPFSEKTHSIISSFLESKAK